MQEAQARSQLRLRPLWYRRDGRLDTSFGDGDGKVSTHFRSGTGAGSVALDSEGRIVIAGTGHAGGHVGFAVARYKPNGKLDPSFGDDGKIKTRFGGGATASAVTCDVDRIVVVGSNGHFVLARYEPNGKLDHSFGKRGKVTTGLRPEDHANAVTINPQGRILVAGSASAPEGFDSDFALTRYRENGSLDPAFGVGGRVTTDLGGDDVANALALDGGRRIVAVGYSADINGQSSECSIAAYRRDGTPDSTFSRDGQKTTPFGGFGAAFSGGLDSQRRIVAVGVNRHGFALARYAPNGNLDSSFGLGGKVATDFGPSDIAEAAAIDSQDRVVAVGHVQNRFLLARYLGHPGQ